MNAIEKLKVAVENGLKTIWAYTIDPKEILINETRSEFEGDYTVVVFPFTKSLRSSPPLIAEKLGEYLVKENEFIVAYNVVKGFLNLSFSHEFWKNRLLEISNLPDFGKSPSNGKKVIVEFSSPNTNKPLHLGHIRNILLGWSSAQILEKAGYEVIKTQIINDRGIAICKSMLAYTLFGNEETPESSSIKGDHFVGKFYVEFENKFKSEYQAWKGSPEGIEIYEAQKKAEESSSNFYARYKNIYFNEHSRLGRQAKEMLLKWESGDEPTIDLWKKMNHWVYEGFDVSYKKLGVQFDCVYYESETYTTGKELIEDGISKDFFYKKEDGSIWVDLEEVGMDQKLVLRSDGTSVYMTQDLGTAKLRNKDHNVDKMVYVVADEQDYHFKALFEILKKIGEPYAEGLHHLSYGMVDLPTGKMKSREGTVVDADDLVEDVIAEARSSSEERGEIEAITAEEKNTIFRQIGLAALKYFIIKVNPRKRMTFDPKESVDMQGQTGPYIQNAYVRIQSVLRKNEEAIAESITNYTSLEEIETALIRTMGQFPALIKESAENLDPSAIANYAYHLAKMYHRFYHELRILSAETESAKIFRLRLSKTVGLVLASAMELLGIEMPKRM